jgi:hypothetical protein
MRRFIVADPRKLTFFAEANAVRAGLAKTAGTLSGLGVITYNPWAEERTEYVTAPKSEVVTGGITSASNNPGNVPASSSTVASSSGSSLKEIFENILSAVGAAAGAFTRAATTPQPQTTTVVVEKEKPSESSGISKGLLLAGGVAAVVGLGYLAFRKKR